jgi:hypothetical protein
MIRRHLIAVLAFSFVAGCTIAPVEQADTELGDVAPAAATLDDEAELLACPPAGTCAKAGNLCDDPASDNPVQVYWCNMLSRCFDCGWEGAASPTGARPEPADAPVAPAASSESAGELEDDDAAILSLRLGVPVSEDDLTPADIDEAQRLAGAPDSLAAGCSTYYGKCSGISGCSVASGGGWGYKACGPFIYAWLTVCDGYPAAFGEGICLF